MQSTARIKEHLSLKVKKNIYFKCDNEKFAYINTY